MSGRSRPRSATSGSSAASTSAAGERITVTAELAPALDGALARAQGTELYALPTYTAMLALRELLARRGHAASSWVRA